MIKIILDTNVVVSALIKSDTPPSKILLDYVPICQFCVSQPILDEYHQVLMRPKFKSIPSFYAQAVQLLHLIEQISILYAPETKLNIIADEPDNRFLELAIYAQADYLITGNTSDFTFSSIENTQIVTPSQFIGIVERIEG